MIVLVQRLAGHSNSGEAHSFIRPLRGLLAVRLSAVRVFPLGDVGLRPQVTRARDDRCRERPRLQLLP